MKLHKMVALLFLIPVIAFGADHSVKLTVKGVAYNSCTVTPTANSTLILDAKNSSQWISNQTYLQDADQYFSFTLTDCDPGTTIKVSAKGTVGTKNWWLANDPNNNAPDLQAALGMVPPDGIGFKFLYPGTGASQTYTTSSNTTETIKIVSSMRREDVSIKPTGKFSTTVTIYFTFT